MHNKKVVWNEFEHFKKCNKMNESQLCVLFDAVGIFKELLSQ